MHWHQEKENFYLGDASLMMRATPMMHGAISMNQQENGKKERELYKGSPARRIAGDAANGEDSPVVLILEDFDSIRAYLKNHFKMQGYDVCSAATILDALEMAEEEYPQVVIIDYDLSGEDAYEAIRRLRTILPLSYIVLMGGPDTAKIEESAKRSGASRVLAKAYELGELDGAVVGALRRSRQLQ